MKTLRIITNDRFAPVPTVIDEAGIKAYCKVFGWPVPDDLDDLGPTVSSEEAVREHAGRYADECLRDFREYRGLPNRTRDVR